jgi:hypothetical protein
VSTVSSVYVAPYESNAVIISYSNVPSSVPSVLIVTVPETAVVTVPASSFATIPSVIAVPTNWVSPVVVPATWIS